MACRRPDRPQTTQTIVMAAPTPMTESLEASQNTEIIEPVIESIKSEDVLYFGADSETSADTMLQHGLTQLEWVTTNKIYPNFWGRYIGGEYALTKEEAAFIHANGVKIAPIFNGYKEDSIVTQEHGAAMAKMAIAAAKDLGIGAENVIFLKIDTGNVSSECMLGYAMGLIEAGYIPGFYANTSAKHFDFCHQFSRGFAGNPEVFGQCKIWALSPGLPEYFETKDAHLIHPDEWTPHCPSCMTRDQIAIWQYGKYCHPTNDHFGKATSFHANLIKDADFLANKLF